MTVSTRPGIAHHVHVALSWLPAATPRPVLFHGSEFDYVSREEAAQVTAAYAAGQPVVLLDAGARAVEKLHHLLDLPLPVAPHKQRWHIYACRQGEGVTEFWNSTPALHTTHSQILDEDTDTAVDDLPADEGEADEPYATHAQLFAEWLKRPATRPTLAETDENTQNLIDLAYAYSSTSTTTYMEATFQVTSYAWAAYVRDSDPNTPDRLWYAVQQNASMNPSGAYTHDDDTHRGYYGKEYSFAYGFSLDGGTTPYTNGSLDQTKPETTQKTSTATSGFSWNIGGMVGFKGKEGTGQVSAGATFSKSYTVPILDVEVLNQSNAQPGIPKFDYQLADPPWRGPAGPASTIGQTPLVGRANFQPVNTFIVHFPAEDLPAESTGLTIATTVAITLKYRYVTAARFAKVRSTTWEPSPFTIAIPPAPPTSTPE